MMDSLTIGQLANATATKAETIRYYERIGLLLAPPRSAGNYRTYGPLDVQRLGFVRRARELGFSIEQIRELLSLGVDAEQDCGDIDQLTRAHVTRIEEKIADLQRLKDELFAMLRACPGGTVAQCQILQSLQPLPSLTRKKKKHAA
ncbi:MAG: helix-turn-helix domain-containing protein [Lysobacter sp.]|nr:helix-turn-helix domain-containing protein [Lysobacter sp.]